MALAGSKGAAGIERGRHGAAARPRAEVACAFEPSDPGRQAPIQGGRARRETSTVQPSASGVACEEEHLPTQAVTGRLRVLCTDAAERSPQSRSACLRQARGSNQHKKRLSEARPGLAPGAKRHLPRLPDRRLPRWRVRTRGRAYESEDSLFRARASEQIASWCLRVGMLMKFRASSSSIRCCGVALNDCSPPWMPSKK
jgi:hypothetical protein